MQGNRTKTVLRWLVGIGAVGLVTYALVFGLTTTLPNRGPILGQTSRNIFYHVPMWFAMMAMGYTSVVQSILFLRRRDLERDLAAKVAARLALLFGVLGLLTGSAWSRVTWGENMRASDPSAWWAWDPKQTSALICVLLYGAFFLLRASFEEPRLRATVSAVYNIFAAASIYPLFYLLPRAMQGLHPGAQGEGATVFDMSPEFYRIFWPSILGFVLLSVWLLDLGTRAEKLRHRIQEIDA
jgi:heme exporter protein C